MSMEEYPRLAEMGVKSPDQVAHFSVNSIDYNDFLRIIYDRPKGSLLPEIRSYRFPRVQVTHAKDDSGDEYDAMESSPALKEAIAELKALLAKRENRRDIAEDMLRELDCLEQEFAVHTERLRRLVGRMEPDA